MNMKVKPEIIAGIDVGSNALRMKIAEVMESGEMRNLEVLRQPISLGRDTFAMGRVSFETVDATCDILKGFKQLMSDYNVKTYRAVATSGIREAQNRDYIVDQIKLKTGLHIDVISNAEERFLIYKSISENLSNYGKIKEEGAMIVDIGSGTLEISIYNHNQLAFSQSMKLGSLRVHEVLSSIEGRTLNYFNILEEYIDSNLDRMKAFMPKEIPPNFIALGGEIRIISKLCNNTGEYDELKYITLADFMNVYKELKNKPPHLIVKEHGVSIERADILVPSMLLFKKLFDITNAQGIYAPLVSLRDGIISDIVDKKLNTKRKRDFIKDIISSAKFIAQKYQYNKAHADYVEEKSLILFDELKRLHGLKERERFLLQLAAILHDIGKFINLNEHYEHSYEIIKASDLIGLSGDELDIVANVARYHSKAIPGYNDEGFRRLGEENRVIISKLVAIIRLADALDRSHKQKIKDLKVTLGEKEAVLRVDALGDILLEEWTFEMKAEFFQEVFGVTPILRMKRKI